MRSSNWNDDHTITVGAGKVLLGNASAVAAPVDEIAMGDGFSISDEGSLEYAGTIPRVDGLQAALDGKASEVHHHLVSDITDLASAVADEVANYPVATMTSAGLMSAQDKVELFNMPSQSFLWSVTHARVPVIANAGDSISHSVGLGGGSSMLTQALARYWPGRLLYGEDSVEAYNGPLTGAIISAEAKTALVSYDGAHSTAAWLESEIAVGKWLHVANSGVSPNSPATWQGRSFKIIAVDLFNNSFTVDYSNVTPLNVGLPQAFPTTSFKVSLSRGLDMYNLAVGGSSSTDHVLYQLPIIKNWVVKPDILILNGGTNDGVYTNSAKNVIAMIDGALDSGVKLVAVMPMTPKDGMNDQAVIKQFVSANSKIRNYVASRDGCYLLDATSLFLDPLSATYQPIGGSTGSVNAVCVDGLHTSVKGAEAFGQVITPLLQKMSAKRYPRALSHLDVWDAVNNPTGNVLGSAGVMYPGTGGQLNGAASAAVPQGLSANSFTVDASTNVAKAPVLSYGVCNYVNSAGHRSLVINLDGLKSANYTGNIISFRLQKYEVLTLFDGTPDYDCELVAKINAPNISVIQISVGQYSAVSGGTKATLGSGSGAVADCSMITPSNEWVFIYPQRPGPTTNTSGTMDIEINIATRANQVLSGTIEIAHAGVFAQPSRH